MFQLATPIYRSFLFVPVLNNKFIDKAAASMADAVILDLEASIPNDRKQDARDALAGATETLKKQSKVAFCRVNAGSCDDLEAAIAAQVQGVIVPQVESSDQLRTAADIIGGATSPPALFPIIETPLGLYNLREIVALDVGVGGLMFGAEDFVTAMGSRAQPCRETLFNAAWQVAMVARAHGIYPYGITGTLANFRDVEAFTQLCLESSSIGFVGCPAIHPDQIAALHRAFSPTQQEIDHAKHVIREFEQAGHKAISVNNKMVDYPIYYRFKKLVEEYDRLAE